MELWAIIRRYVCLTALLCSPVYFASQAKEVLSWANGAEGYNGTREPPANDWTSRSSLRVYGTFQDGESISPIPLPPPVYRTLLLPAHRHGDNGPLVSSISYTSQLIQSFRNAALESSWISCVNHWCKLWRIIASVAFTILAGSSALLQMPGTNGDPLTRCFVYLFILRLVPALLSAGVLLYYFSKGHFRSGNFAMIWCQHVERYRQSCLYMPWTILSLPAIAISWGSIFMLTAVFLSVWGNGLYPNLSSVEEVSSLTIMSLRLIITAMSLVDVGWVCWLIVKLRAFDKAARAVQAAA